MKRGSAGGDGGGEARGGGGEARDATIRFRVSLDEQQAIRRSARHAHMSVSAWIRHTLLTTGGKRERAR